MTEFCPDFAQEPTRLLIDRNYDMASSFSPSNVRRRFETYNYAAEPVDFEALVADSLGLHSSDKDIVDVGTADGGFLYRLRWEYEAAGSLTGIDPNISQFNIDHTPKSPIFMSLVKTALDGYFGRSSSEEDLLKSLSLPENQSPVNLLEGRAHDLSKLKDDSADLLTAMFMLYHVAQDERDVAFSEFKRVLKPEGVFVIATSGNDNKRQHRIFEQAIAEQLGPSVIPPQPMNAGFTTEKASLLIPEHFKHVYRFDQATNMRIGDTMRSLLVYYDSLRSLRNQYQPEPTEKAFDGAIKDTAQKTILKAILGNGVFLDIIRRSLFMASDSPLDDSRLRANNFVRIK